MIAQTRLEGAGKKDQYKKDEKQQEDEQAVKPAVAAETSQVPSSEQPVFQETAPGITRQSDSNENEPDVPVEPQVKPLVGIERFDVFASNDNSLLKVHFRVTNVPRTCCMGSVIKIPSCSGVPGCLFLR